MPMFTRFSAAYPDIEVHIQVSNRYVRLAERDADVAIRLTNTPQDTLIGTKLVTVASTVYGSHDYCARLRAGTAKEKWLGLNAADFTSHGPKTPARSMTTTCLSMIHC